MSLERITPGDISRILNERTPHPEGIYKRSSVLVPVLKGNDGLEVLFCTRSMNLRHQPGDICFPGGRAECGETPLATALRETEEEIGISQENITVLGATDYIVTPYSAIVSPYLGLVEGINIETDLDLNPDEVDGVFTVPLKFFMETSPKEYFLEVNMTAPDEFPYDLIVGGKDYRWGHTKLPELFYIYNDYVIWGLTARIMSHICRLINRKLLSVLK